MNPAWWHSLATPKNRQILSWIGVCCIVLIVVSAGTWAVGAESAAKLLDAVTRLLGVLIWPAAIFFLVVRHGRSLGDFITTSVKDAKFKAAGVEASVNMRERQIEVATALTAANVSAIKIASTSSGQGSAGTAHVIERTAAERTAVIDAAEEDARKAVMVADRIDRKTIQQAEGSRVLWVDDRPENNNHERQALEATGVRFTISTSTEDALDKLKAQKFQAIISDIGRPPDPRAGYTLLDALRSSGNQTPYIIYAGSRSPEHQQEAKRKGAIGCTNVPSELFQMVLSAIQHDA